MKDSPFSLWLDSAALAFEAQQVIALRMMRLALGGAVAQREMQRMVTEKATTAALAGFGAAMSMVEGSTREAIAGDALRTVRRRVRANRKRLGRRR